MEEVNNQQHTSFFCDEKVNESYRSEIRIRIDTLLTQRGVRWSDVYKKLGWFKSFASIVRNGKLIPKAFQRVALARELGVDSSVIWHIEDLQINRERQTNEF